MSEVDSVLTAVYTPLDAGPCTLSLSAGGALEGETQSEGGTAATLKLEYTAGGEKQAGSTGASQTAAGNAVKTGDTFTYMLWAAAVLAAGAVILIERKKQK